MGFSEMQRIRSRASRGVARVWATVMWVGAAALSACGGGPSADELERSSREFQLAATLRQEGNVPAAIERLAEAIKLDPDNARAHILMGFIHMERRNFAGAEESLSKGISLLEAHDGRGSTLAEARNLLGLALIHLNRPREAEPILRKSATDALNTAPHLAWGNLGLAHYEAGEYDKALEALLQAVGIQPRFCVGYFLIGKTHFAREELTKAEEALNHAIEADELCTENYQEAWRLRGETRARLGHREEAIADFERCVELNPRSEDGQTCQRLLASTGNVE